MCLFSRHRKHNPNVRSFSTSSSRVRFFALTHFSLGCCLSQNTQLVISGDEEETRAEPALEDIFLFFWGQEITACLILAATVFVRVRALSPLYFIQKKLINQWTSPSCSEPSLDHSIRISWGRWDSITGVNTTPYWFPLTPKDSKLRIWKLSWSCIFQSEAKYLDWHDLTGISIFYKPWIWPNIMGSDFPNRSFNIS